MRRAKRLTAAASSNSRQTLGARIRWLRAKQKPYMTQQQLADRARVDVKLIVSLEKDCPSTFSVQMDTLRRVAHALDCRVFINIKSRLTPSATEFQQECPELPPLPKRKGRGSALARKLALLHGRSYDKRALQKKSGKPHKEISDKPSSSRWSRSRASRAVKAGLLPKPHDTPSQEK